MTTKKQLSVTPCALLRLSDVLALYPVGRSTWLQGVKTGQYPAAVKISARCSAWLAKDIFELIERVGARS